MSVVLYRPSGGGLTSGVCLYLQSSNDAVPRYAIHWIRPAVEQPWSSGCRLLQPFTCSSIWHVHCCWVLLQRAESTSILCRLELLPKSIYNTRNKYQYFRYSYINYSILSFFKLTLIILSVSPTSFSAAVPTCHNTYLCGRFSRYICKYQYHLIF